MYTDMQSKKGTSRTLQQAKNTNGQLFQMKDNRKNMIQLMYDKTAYLEYESTPDGMGRAKTVHANIKRNGFANLDGGSPSVEPVGWRWLQRTFGDLSGKWVRFHILNQYMGGHGDDKANLIPTTHHVNHSALWRDLEEYMKYDSQVEDLVFNAEVLGYYSIPVEEPGFPKGINVNLYAKETGQLIHCYSERFSLPEGLVETDIQDLINVHSTIHGMQQPNLPENYPMREGKVKKRPWSVVEDGFLFNAVRSYGEGNWSAIALFVGNRSRSECFERWSRHLNPRISKSTWMPAEDEVLKQLVGQYGDKNWVLIANKMGNRTDCQCRYRYRALVRNATNPRPAHPRFVAMPPQAPPFIFPQFVMKLPPIAPPQ